MDYHIQDTMNFQADFLLIVRKLTTISSQAWTTSNIGQSTKEAEVANNQSYFGIVLLKWYSCDNLFEQKEETMVAN